MAEHEGNLIDAHEFERISDESIERVLNLATWSPDPDLGNLIDRIEREVGEAVGREAQVAETIRRRLFPRIGDLNRADAPPECGVYQVEPAALKRVWTLVLFNGGVEACDGTRKQIATLPLTITQLGVCLASYRGDQQSFAHRIFQRDLHGATGNLLDDALTLLDRRSAKTSAANGSRSVQKKTTELFSRGVMTYVERAVLADASSALWRMGHGQPAPYELLTGAGMVSSSGQMPLLNAAADALRRLVLEHRKFIFVPSEFPDGRLITMGNALRPCEYAIISTTRAQMSEIVENGHYSRAAQAVARSLADDLGPNIAMGVYRASAAAPPQIFYSHIDHSHEAALIALADSFLQQHRGFPLLIDLADRLCQSAFGNDIFDGAVKAAYARAKAPYQYFGEHVTRTD